MDDVFTYIVDLPCGIHEAVMPCADGYTVYLSASDSHDRQMVAYNHALQHIKNYDWGKQDVQAIERVAHGQ